MMLCLLSDLSGRWWGMRLVQSYPRNARLVPKVELEDEGIAPATTSCEKAFTRPIKFEKAPELCAASKLSHCVPATLQE